MKVVKSILKWVGVFAFCGIAGVVLLAIRGL